MPLPQFLSGNQLHLLVTGEAYFPALIAAIDASRDELFLETYIFADDQTGSLIAQALARAAIRGVRVQLLIDGFGARDFAPRFRALLQEAGVRVLVFRPQISPWTFQRHRLRRMHRKMVAVDGELALVGGINVIDDYDTPGQTPPRYDYAVQIRGPLAQQVRDAAARLWSRVAWAHLQREWRVASHVKSARRPWVGQSRAALVVRDNVRHRRDIEVAYLTLIARAREEIILANAYFFPGRRFRRALQAAAARKVRVVLLLQGRVEYALFHYAARALYGSLLDAGIEIYEYKQSFLHAKVAVIDGRWSSVGSSNIDPFSLLLAREANVFADDRAFALTLRTSLLNALETGAQRLLPAHWHAQPLMLRVRMWLAYGLTRFLLALSGTSRWQP